jgi:predicted transcriptional regulator
MDKIQTILFWRLKVVADDLNRKVNIEEVVEKLGLTQRESADAMDRFSQDKGVKKTARVRGRGGNSKFPIFSLLGVAWKSDEELVSDSKLVVFTGENIIVIRGDDCFCVFLPSYGTAL